MSNSQKIDLFFQTVEKVKVLAKNFEIGLYAPDEAIQLLTGLFEGLTQALEESNQE